MDKLKKREEKQQFIENLKAMRRYDLISLCIKQYKRLTRLSEICDVEDVYLMIKELQDLQTSLEAKKRLIWNTTQEIHAELDKRGIEHTKTLCLSSSLRLLLKDINKE